MTDDPTDAWRVTVTLPVVPPLDARDALLDDLFALVTAWAPTDRDWDPVIDSRVVPADEEDDRAR